jgi:ABC-type glycerol-3-phosphate transport system substrate-binding protein
MPPKNIYEDNTDFSTPVTSQSSTSTVSSQQVSLPAVPPHKKTFPKIFIFIGAGLVVLVLLILVVKLILSSKNGASGQITWWGLWEDPATVTPLINAYQASHPGVKISYINQSQQDYRERLTSAVAKGNGPDIFTFHNSWVPMFRSDLDTLPTGVMNPADFAKTFYPTAASDLTSGNSIVGIPLEYDALMLFVNEDIFKKAGKTPPTTWDDFRTTACELTTKDDQGNITQAGAALGRTENVDQWQEILALMMIQNNVDLANPTGKNAEGALKFFTQFSQDAACNGGGNVWDVTQPPSTQAFASGKLAMYVGPSWRYFEIQQANHDLNFTTAPIPQLPKDDPNQLDIDYATYWSQGVWAKSKNKAVAWDFLKYLSTQASLQKMFESESLVRGFGEPYPRVDMASLLKDHPFLGPLISQAPGAQSWFLASRTFDGPTGINSQLSNYFGDAVNAVADSKQSVTDALATCAQGVAQVLSQYKLTVK